MASSKEWECAYHLKERIFFAWIVPIASAWYYQTTHPVRDSMHASKALPEREAMRELKKWNFDARVLVAMALYAYFAKKW